MLSNLDRNTKHNILEQYKRDAISYRQQKQNERIKRIQEEREYILERIRKEKETDFRLKQEKLKRQKDQMKEYYNIIKRLKIDKPGYHLKPHNREVINKNWGKNRYESEMKNKIIENNNNIANSNIIINKDNLHQNKNLSQSQKEREYVRKEDNMSNYLTDKNNMKEFQKYLFQEKQKRIKYYKDILDSQYQEIQSKNKEKYGTLDPLIVRREKRNNLIDNPYSRNSQYDFGSSSLSHNPITNPENNIHYNKYLFKENSSGTNKRNNYNNNLKIYERNKENNTGHIFANNFFKFKTSDNSHQNNGLSNNRSSINIFRHNLNDNLEQNNNKEKNNINKYINYKYQNINNNYNDLNYLDFHSMPTPSGKAINRNASSNYFS